MLIYVVQFHDAYGHREVRKVSGNAKSAEDFITNDLAKLQAIDVDWQSNRTYCTAWAQCRGPQSGMEFISYSIEAHELTD